MKEEQFLKGRAVFCYWKKGKGKPKQNNKKKPSN